MDHNHEEFVQEEDDGAPLLNIPENMRPPVGAEVLQRQGSQPVSQPGGSSTVEEAKKESTEGENLKEEDFNRTVPKPKDQQVVLDSVQGSLAVSQPGDNLRVEEKARKGKRKAPSTSSVEEVNTDATEEVPDCAEWSKEAIIALLEAHQQVSEKNHIMQLSSLSQDQWQAITDVVNVAEKTGTSKTWKQCRYKYDYLKSKKIRESNSSSATAALSIREWYLQTHKIFEWDADATGALLEIHWAYSEGRVKPGRIDQLDDAEWDIIANIMKPNVTGAQCRERINELIAIHSDDQYIGKSSRIEWVYSSQINRLIAATLGSSHNSSDRVAPASGSQSEHP